MCLKGKANQKDDLTSDVKTKIYFQRRINSKICIEYGMKREGERKEKGEEPKTTPCLNNQKMLIPFSENKTDKHKNKKKVCVWGGQTNNPKQRIQTESSHGQEENEFRFGYILLLMFLNSMPIYVNKHCLQSQIVDHVN